VGKIEFVGGFPRNMDDMCSPRLVKERVRPKAKVVGCASLTPSSSSSSGGSLINLLF
jgi:hypothetical protein